MRRFVNTALMGGLILMLTGILSLAADAPQATVGDLVELIAASKKMKVEEVEKFLSAGGFSLESGAALTEQIAADLFGTFGIRMTASRDRAIRVDQVGRLGAVASFLKIEASGSDEVKNNGRKTRKGGNTPNSNADPNAFETIREDVR